MHSLTGILAVNLAAVATLMTLGWMVSLVRRNVTVVDSLWGLGFVITAWVTFFLAGGFSMRRWLVTLLVTAWGLRLSIYLSIRNWGKGEDPRYAKWRKATGKRFWIASLFKVFWLQSVFLWVISWVVQVPQTSARPEHLTPFDLIGFFVVMIGILYESVADWQLYRFKKDPENRKKVMDFGLWRYSRHPNYFGECLTWWGMFIIALSVPGSWWTILSPVTITLVLVKMTGVPLTEAAIRERKPGYREYMSRTSTLIPWIPRKDTF